MALDEAHIIRNPATSVSQGAATLSAGGSGGMCGGWVLLYIRRWVQIQEGGEEGVSTTSVSLKDWLRYVQK